MDMVISSAHGIISGLSLVVIAWIARQLRQLMGRFGSMEAAQKNQLKISDIYGIKLVG